MCGKLWVTWSSSERATQAKSAYDAVDGSFAGTCVPEVVAVEVTTIRRSQNEAAEERCRRC